MPKRSAGILMYRRTGEGIEVLLVHPGGPFWRNKDRGAWTIPKGEFEGGEAADTAARREFREELGIEAVGSLIPLGTIRQRAGKEVIGFAIEGDFDPATLASDSFEIEWPPGSGRRRAFPEVDRAGWFPPAEARDRINEAQRALLDRLDAALLRPHCNEHTT